MVKCEGNTCKNDAMFEILYDIGDGDTNTHQICEEHYSKYPQFQNHIITKTNLQ